MLYGRRLARNGAFAGKASVVAAVVAVFFLASPAWATTFTVMNKNDSGTGSLRQAIIDANNTSGDDTIEFASDVSGTIDLTSALTDLSTNIEIKGPGADKLTVRRSTASGTSNFRIFRVTSSGTVSISGLTISNGNSDSGGGIYNNGGTLNVSNSTISANSASAAGGIYNFFTTVNVQSSIVAGNSGGQLSSFTDGSFNYMGGDPKLGPLQDNGGPTETHLPLDDSPVLDQGNSFGATAPDQRGEERPQDAAGIPNAQGGDGRPPAPTVRFPPGCQGELGAG